MLLTAYTALAANAILLLAMVTVYDLVTAKLRPVGRRRRDVVLGLLLGTIGIAIMAVPYPVDTTSLRFDARSVLLGATGLFTGPLPTLVAMAITAAYRVWLGGDGLPMGLATIVNSGLIGLAWHHRRRQHLSDLTWSELLALGMAVHVATLIGTLLLPIELRHQTLDAVMIPVLIILPLATMVIGLLLRDRVRRDREFVALQATEQRLALALAAGGQGIFDVDLLTGDAIVSPEYASMLGYDPATFHETNAAWLERLHPDDHQRVSKTLDDYLAGRLPEYRVEFRQRTALGEWHWVRSVGRATARGADGKPTRILGTHTDIQNQKAAEATGRLTMAALDAAADAIVITDRDGIILWCNPAFTTLTGFQRSEALGSNPRRLVKSGVQSQEFYETLWTTLLAGEVWRGELVNRRKDRSRYLEQQTITPVRNELGEVTNFIAIKRDLTAQRQLEAQFHQSQKMESVGRLAGSVAHDFNNLLTVINSSIDLARSTIPPDHAALADLEEAERAGARAVLLTRQLLGFSRQQPARVESLDLADVVQGILPMIERLIGENIEIEINVDGPLAPVLVDRGQMEQVLMNLAINARDAMPRGGMLAIGLARAEDAVELSVRDNGLGMDSETQAHLFEPFFTTKEPGKGTGLGLATIFGIVSGAGGTIRVASAVSEGTTFTIRLPAATAPLGRPAASSAAVPVERAQPASRERPRILIVEDEEAIRRVMRRVLERAGFEVVDAEDGEHALAAVAAGDGFALLITDMMMPGMTGGELVVRLRQLQSNVPVIMTSGYSAEFTRERAGVGAEVTFLSKPFAIDELVGTVRTVLARTA